MLYIIAIQFLLQYKIPKTLNTSGLNSFAFTATRFFEATLKFFIYY